jgi:hypothetical protein
LTPARCCALQEDSNKHFRILQTCRQHRACRAISGWTFSALPPADPSIRILPHFRAQAGICGVEVHVTYPNTSSTPSRKLLHVSSLRVFLIGTSSPVVIQQQILPKDMGLKRRNIIICVSIASPCHRRLSPRVMGGGSRGTAVAEKEGSLTRRHGCMDNLAYNFTMLRTADRRRTALKDSCTPTWLEFDSQSTESCPRWLVGKNEREICACDDGL